MFELTIGKKYKQISNFYPGWESPICTILNIKTMEDGGFNVVHQHEGLDHVSNTGSIRLEDFRSWFEPLEKEKKVIKEFGIVKWLKQYDKKI